MTGRPSKKSMNIAKKNTLHIVIVNYRSTDYLEGCLAGIPPELDRLKISVTVIDNNSDETPELTSLQERYHWIELKFNKDNLGFSRACNQGIRSREADLYLLLNPDTVVNPEALESCARFLLENQEAGIAGCRILNPDGTDQKASRRNIPTPASAFLHFSGLHRFLGGKMSLKAYHPAAPAGDTPLESEAVSGSFLMFKRDVNKTAGYLDEDFFMYGEDLDFCYRAGLDGWKTFFLPGISILHFKRISSSRSAESANLHFFRAMEIFYRKHYYPESGWISRFVVGLGIRLLRTAAVVRIRLSPRKEVGSRG